MELDFEGKHADRAYPILASLVTPRPIALVTTLSPDGKLNAAPFSFFNVLGAEPPIVAFAPGDRDDGTPKDTALNIRLTREFVGRQRHLGLPAVLEPSLQQSHERRQL